MKWSRICHFITLVTVVNVDLIDVCLKTCFFPSYFSNWECSFFALNEHLENHSLGRENENSQDSALRDPWRIVSETQKLSFKMSYSPILHPILLFKPGTRMLFWEPYSPRENMLRWWHLRSFNERMQKNDSTVKHQIRKLQPCTLKMNVCNASL